MPYFVYIIHSEKLNRFYIGTTDDVQKRLIEHNSAKYINSFSIKGIPWSIYLSIKCKSSQQADQVEGFIKRMKSAIFIRKLKSHPSLIVDIVRRFE